MPVVLNALMSTPRSRHSLIASMELSSVTGIATAYAPTTAPPAAEIIRTVVRSFSVSFGSAPASSSMCINSKSLLLAARASGVVPSPSDASPVGV